VSTLRLDVCETCGDRLTELLPIDVVGVGLRTPSYEREDCGLLCLNPQCRMSIQLSYTPYGLFVQPRRMSLDEYEDLMRGYDKLLQDSRVSAALIDER
jgi:hypothetical protein